MNVNSGRKQKPIDGEPMGAFLIEKFKDFAWQWEKPKDLKRLGIKCAPNEWPMVGNVEVLKALLHAAAAPEEVKPETERARILVICLNRSPDFVLALLTYLRRELAKCSNHKRAILFGKPLGGSLHSLSNAEKTERTRLRKLTEKAKRDKDQAAQHLRKVWETNSGNRTVETHIQVQRQAKPRKISYRKPRRQLPSGR